MLLAGCAGTIAMASPSLAQETPGDGETGADSAAEAAPIVVTGSRIVRQDYQSNSPMVTIDEALLQQSSTAAIESNLNKLPQFTPAKTPTAGGDIQPTSTNTPGAATVSLRGLGANRNLVLIDGRRATPSNAAGVVDINTIPSAAVERVEIISGGASSTYGADAVAGVTNFILKKNFQGVELDGQMGISQEGDGFEYQISGIMGSDFDDGRGNVSIAASLNTRDRSFQADRDWYRDLWADPMISTNRFFPLYAGVALGANGVSLANESIFYNQIFPGTTRAFDANGQPFANTIAFSPTTAATAPNIRNISFYVNPGDGQLFTTGRNQQGGISSFTGPLLQGDTAEVRANNTLTFVDHNAYLVLPLTRYNMFMRGNYEINDWIGIFGQGLFSQTKTRTTQQGGSITSGWDVFIPYGTGVYTGSANPATAYGSVGLPSSVILNGMLTNGALNGVGTTYVDNTPGDLSDNPTNPVFAKEYGSQYACALSAVGGCTNNQVLGQFLPTELQQLLNLRQDPNGRVELQYGYPENRSVTNKVTTFNILAGFEGKIPGTDWTWEAFGNYGETSTFTAQTGIFSLTRERTLLMAPGFGKGMTANSNEASGRPAFGANFAGCTSGFNIFTTPWDQVSQDCKEALRSDLKNNQTISQLIAEVNLQGSLFDLPAGTVRGAFGASYRELDYEFVNDTLTGQGQSYLDQAVGIYPSSDTYGAYDVKEVYGELLVPVLSGIPAVEQFNLELGLRYSDYSTTGASWTYKILGDWEITPWLRARGGYNRAERAPNIAELFLAPSQLFGNNALGDLCSERSTYFMSANGAAQGNTAERAADIKATCAAVMERTGGAGTAAQYYTQRLVSAQPIGGGFAWTNAEGNPNLKPEVADTWTAGIVVQSPFDAPALRRLRFTADWWSIDLHDAIGVTSAGIALQQCLDPNYNTAVTGAANGTTFTPGGAVTVGSAAQAAGNNPFCAGIRYDPLPALGAANFDVTYVNAGQVSISGIDFQLDWAVDAGPGTFTLNALVNYYLHYKSRELASNPFVDYVGTLGTAQNSLNAGAYEFRALTTIGYRMGPAHVNLQWQYLPSVDVEAAAVAPTTFKGYPSYSLFNLQGGYELSDKISLRGGIDNLFNKRPPIGNINTAADLSLGQLPGGSFNSNFYDTIGRRFYIGANIEF